MVTWNCTSCLSAAVVVLLSDDLKWDFLVQMCILDTVTRNPVVLLSPYPSLPVPFSCLGFRTHGLNERMLGVCKMAWMTGEIGSHNESSEPSHQLVQQESAALLRSLLSRHNTQHCAFLTSPLKNGNAMEQAEECPPPWSGARSLRFLCYPQGLWGAGWRRACTPYCAFFAYAGESPAYPASAVTACGGGGEVVLQALRKLVVSILSFAAAALFFFSPHHSPLPMRVVCLNHILQNQFSKQIRWAAETAMQSGKNVHSSLHFMQWPEQ